MEKEASIVRVCLGALVALLIGVSFIGPMAENGVQLTTVSLPDVPSIIRVRLKALGKGPWTLDASAHLDSEDGDVLQAGTRITHDGSMLCIDGVAHARVLGLFPAHGHPITLNHRPYPGHCTIHDRENFDDPVVIAHVESELYVSHVLPAEMPLHYPEGALRAQAVAIRTYGLWQAQNRQDRLWDVMDGQTSQVFVGGTATLASIAPVQATDHQVLLFRNELLPTYYSAICGGATRSNQEAFGAEELAPLAGVSCNYCRWTRTRNWTVKVSSSKLRSALGLSEPVLGVRIEAIGNSGYDSDLVVETASGETSFSTTEVRKKVGGGMRSSWFEKATFAGSSIVIHGLGFGHGVGLCQTGARRLAQQGRNYVEVLDFYYRGARLIRLENERG
jgi:stage II sporulation protein D